MSARTLAIAAPDGSRFPGYLAAPAGGRGAGVVLLPEVFGLTDAMKALADAYAEAGYATLLPDMYWRKGEALAFGDGARAEAADVFLEVGGLDGYRDNCAGAAEALRAAPECAGGRVVVVGYGVGGTTAFMVAAEGLVEAAVSFYPPIVHLSLAPALAVPWQLHFAAADRGARPHLYRDAAATFDGDKRADIRRYDGADYGFAVPGRDAYDDGAACLAFDACLAFLAAALTPGEAARRRTHAEEAR